MCVAVSQALGRVLRDEDLEGPRGPDATLRVSVPHDWLKRGVWIEVDLPRTLPCAACAGGGCDKCGRSGAVVTRGRKELPEVIDLRLPETEQGATMRLPKRGGLPEDGDETVGRGILLLTVVPAEAPSDGVRHLEDRDDVVDLVAEPEGPLAPVPQLSPATPLGLLLVAALVLVAALAWFSFAR
jgi:hypothetical protein